MSTALRNRSFRASLLGQACLAVAFASVANQAAAQTTETPKKPAADQTLPPAKPSADQTDTRSDTLTDIVVTAQRRGENLQDVPLTVSAIDAQSTKEQGITNTSDLSRAIPGLSIDTVGNAVPIVFMRGVGTPNTTAGDEPSNAFYIDGVYIPDMSSTQIALNNIQRVEILKGPQGTLFGRNATGGLVQIVTRDPSASATADISAGYSSYNTFDGEFYGSTPLSTGVAIDLALHYHNQTDGWGTNIFNGQDIYRDRNFAARSKLKMDFGTDTTVWLAADYSKENSSQVGRQVLPGFVANDRVTTYSGNFFNVNLNAQPFETTETGGGSIRLEHEFSWGKLVNIAAARKTRFEFFIDTDGTPVGFSESGPIAKSHYFSEELQLQSLPASSITWIGGLFIYRHNIDVTLNRRGTSLASSGNLAQVFSNQLTTSYAAYAQVTVPIGKRLKLTAGGRYTKDTRYLESSQSTPVRGAFGQLSTSNTWPKVTYRVTASYDLADRVSVYASQSRGFKSGVFNLYSPTLTPINPEVLDATEIGLKSEFLGGRVRLNVAGYRYNYKNIQLSVSRAGVTNTFNAASAKIMGLDAELTARPAHGLTLRAAANVIDGHYGSFLGAPGTLPNPVTVVPPGYTCPATRPTTVGGTLACTLDASGHRTIRSPKLTYNLGVNYSVDVGHSKATFDLSYYHNSGYSFEVDNTILQPAYGTVNAQVSFDFDSRYTVRLWTKNLTNERYYSGRSTSISNTYFPAAPRTVGISLEAHF